MESKLWRSRLVQVVLSLFLVAGLLLAACGPAATPTTAPTATPRPTATPAPGATPAPTPRATPVPYKAGEPYRIGVADTILFGLAEMTRNALAGMEMAIDDYTEGTGVIQGRKIELIWRETELNPENALRRARELVEEVGVEVLVAALLSSETRAIQGYTKDGNVIQMNYLAESPILLYEGGHRYYFGTWPNLRVTTAGTADFLKDKGYKRIALFYQDYLFGQQAVKFAAENVRRLMPGAEVVAEVAIPLGEPDMRPYLTRILASEPDLLWQWFFGDDTVTFVKQATPLGLFEQMDVFGADTSVDLGALRALGADLPDGYMSYTLYNAVITDTPESRDLQTRFWEKTGRQPADDMVFLGYAMMEALLVAIDKAGTTEREAVVDALETLTWTSRVLGTAMSIDPPSHQVLAPMYFVTLGSHPDWPFKMPKTWVEFPVAEQMPLLPSAAEVERMRAEFGG